MTKKRQIYLGNPSIGTDMAEKLKTLQDYYNMSIPAIIEHLVITAFVEIKKNDLQRNNLRQARHGYNN
jgi:hypothetical protein